MFSTEQELETAMPQGPVLGPLILFCHLLPMELLIKQLLTNYLVSAVNTVIYFVYEQTVTQEKFFFIFSTIQNWFCGAKLKLNLSKSEFIKVKLKEVSSLFIDNFSNFL